MFEKGRFGDDYIKKSNQVRSEEKAISKFGAVYGEAAEQYGKAYAALPPDSKVCKAVIKQVSRGVGSLSETSTEEEIKTALENYNKTFLEPGKTIERVSDVLTDYSKALVVSTGSAPTAAPALTATGSAEKQAVPAR